VGTCSAGVAVVGAGVSSTSAIWTVSPGARPSGFETEAPWIAPTLLSIAGGFAGALGGFAVVLVAAAAAVVAVAAVAAELSTEEEGVAADPRGLAAAIAAGVPAGAAAAGRGLPTAACVLAAAAGDDAGALDFAVDEGAVSFVGVAAAFVAGLETAVPLVAAAFVAGLETAVSLVGAFAAGVFEAGATVADSTLEVMFGDPAELGADALEDAVDAVVPATVVAEDASCFGETADEVLWTPLAVVLVGACVAGLDGFTVVGVLVLTAMPDPAFALLGALDPDLVVTAMVEVAGGVRTDAGSEFWTVTVFAGTDAALCAAGTRPAPGVPIPGNTVPSCRLPSFGRVAGGVEMGEEAGACAVAAGFLSGKLIGGDLGGTGIGAWAAVLDVSGTGSGLRRKTPISGAEAAGAAPLRRAVAVSGPCTRKVIVLPSALSV